MVGRTMMRARASWLLFGVAALAVGTATHCVPQERISGRADVTDGDSLEIGSASVRLYGVDAPEGRQSCTRDGRPWACGDDAARKLRSLIGDRTVTCTQRDVDDYGRIVAVCRSGATDLAAEMARSGFATAYRRYSNDYVDEESQARAARRGIWAGEFTQPEEWRRDDRDATPSRLDNRDVRAAQRGGTRTPSRPDGCYIKGNISGADERIYHVPGSSSYDGTVVDETKGERWFCTEAQARAAGWRAPKNP
jgi:endonuclease YncB( thermonuclease family)